MTDNYSENAEIKSNDFLKRMTSDIVSFIDKKHTVLINCTDLHDHTVNLA